MSSANRLRTLLADAFGRACLGRNFRRFVASVPTAALAVAGMFSVLALAGCSAKKAPTDQPTPAVDAPQPAALQFSSSLPHVGGPPGYVGSHACESCHRDEYASWHRSFHRSMTQLATAETVKARFDHVQLTNDQVRFTLTKTNDEFWAHMERDSLEGAVPAGPPALDVRLGLITGSHHMQVFWVPSGQGNAQVGFPFTWLIPEERWVPRHATFIRPPDAGHRSEIWNLVCCRCHTTGIEPQIDGPSHSADTRAGELGIACEACHGPGDRHTRARQADRDQTSVDAKVLAQEIVHPKKLDPARAAQICGFCHSMKWFDQSENWRKTGFRYRPGDDLELTTPIIRPSRGDQVPGLADFLKKNPELLQDYFWPDGMIRVSGRDYNGLVESPCFKGGQFSCLSCHSLHKSEPANQLAPIHSGNLACTQCHESYADSSRLLAHTHHQEISSGSSCYNCHMPHTSYGVLKAIRSHQISSPKVAVQLTTGRPNACNLCHLDKSLSWTADYLARWYGQAVPPLDPRHSETAEAVRLALSGDAGQRALIAWHFGWDSALETSGRAWIPPILAQLLDDPYAAVRCVAERSFAPWKFLLPAHFDFAQPLAERPMVSERVVTRWLDSMRGGPVQLWANETLVRADDPIEMRRSFEKWIQLRDNRSVRLRE